MNINPEIRETLIKLGLNEIEVQIYITLLLLEVASVQQLAKKSKYKRASLYPYIASLKEKGFIAETKNGKRSLLVSEKPAHLINIWEKQRKTLDDLAVNLNKTIEFLDKIKPSPKGVKPNIIFYEGIDGVKRIYNDTLTTKKDVLAWFPAQSIDKALGVFHDDYVERRVKKGIWARGILLDDELEKFLRKKSPEQLRDPVFLPLKKYPFTNEINVYDDKVAVMSTKGAKIGLIIQNQEFANTMRSLHKMCWDFAKSLEKKRK